MADAERTPNVVRMSLNLSPQAGEILEQLARRCACSKSEVLRKSIALFEVGLEARERGNSLAVVDKDDRLVTRVVGL